MYYLRANLLNPDILAQNISVLGLIFSCKNHLKFFHLDETQKCSVSVEHSLRHFMCYNEPFIFILIYPIKLLKDFGFFFERLCFN